MQHFLLQDGTVSLRTLAEAESIFVFQAGTVSFATSKLYTGGIVAGDFGRDQGRSLGAKLNSFVFYAVWHRRREMHVHERRQAAV